VILLLRLLNVNIHLGQGLSKPQHFELAIRKATELGVREITPIISQHSENYIKMARWQKIIIHAAQQSGRTSIPQINAPCEYDAWVQGNPGGIILDPWGFAPAPPPNRPPSTTFPKTLPLGPEGGFSRSEVEFACQNNFTPVKLGNLILRTETASTAIISILTLVPGSSLAPILMV
jgi:16S rRNA (uracil1498-N3)-methyltransferase